MTTSQPQISYAGVAAVDELDHLLTHEDFEPANEVDTIALDVLPDALVEARRLLEALELLHTNLKTAGTADEAAGLKLDVRLAAEAIMGTVAEMGA